MNHITLDGKHLFAFLLLVMGLFSTLAVVAFQARVAPIVFGHTTDEIQFNTTYLATTTSCGMAAFATIANSSGTTYCGLTAYDDDSTTPLSTIECIIQRRSDGFWEYRFANGCGDTTCIARCIKLN